MNLNTKMFTRSAKRIVNSPELELKINKVKTGRKTRSHKQQVNYDVEGVSKKKHYVLRCPSDSLDEDNGDGITQVPLRTRKSRRITIKEVTNNDVDMPKHIKITRPKRITEDDILPESSQKIKKKLKKKKTLQKVAPDKVIEASIDGSKVVLIERKNSSGFLVIEDLLYEPSSIASVESFHSAAGGNVGSPKLEANKSDLKPMIKNNIFFNDNTQSNTVTKNEAGLTEEAKQDSYQDTVNIEQQETSYNHSPFNLLFDKDRQSRSSYKNSTFNEISNVECNKETSLKMNDTSKIISPSVHDSVKINTPLNITFDKETCYINSTHENEVNSNTKINGGKSNNITPVKKSNIDRSVEKIMNQSSSSSSTTTENDLNTPNKLQTGKINLTFEKDKVEGSFDENTAEANNIQNASIANLDKKTDLNTTFEKLDATFDKAEEVSKFSIITSDTSSNYGKSVSYISITSDESKSENIVNTSPLIVESSLEESRILHKSPFVFIANKITKKSPSAKNSDVIKTTHPAPLNRQGTFTKESPPQTPVTKLHASPGSTPFPSKSGLSKKPVLNVTKSIEKARKSSVAELPHATRVVFCSPINTPMITNQVKGKVVKSSMKGSNKSFMFDARVSGCGSSGRKRSLTQSDLDDLDIKRQRTDNSIRLSRSRTTSASGKIQKTPMKSTPAKPKAESGIARKKLPNFAILHQKHFDKMESLDECQERKAKRAQMLSAGASIAAKDKDSKVETKQAETKYTLLPINSGYTRFGFKIKSNVNPFNNDALNITKESKISPNISNALPNTTSKLEVNQKELPIGVKRQAMLPSLAGSTVRKEIAKQTIMREKSFAEKRKASRKETRTIIKGVRTNRRFDLQMQMRNII